jgi:FdhE protein
MTLNVWLERHPYLQSVANLQLLVDATAAEVSIPRAGIPKWECYVEEFRTGIALLQSSTVAIDLEPAEKSLVSLTERLATKPLPHDLTEQIQILDSELNCEQDAPRRAVSWLLSQGSFVIKYPGLLQYIGWTVLARYLDSVVTAFNNWRDEEQWLRNYCPTCAASPAMAQLAGVDAEKRLRKLLCGRCGTLWRYRRTGCPFCENDDDHRLAVVAIEGEGGLRIDYCHACGGYLKTYAGEGKEHVLLADWTSAHLDVLARDRGMKRLAASLYEL